MDPSDVADRGPTLVLEEYFEGRSKAWGMFHDRFGNLRRRFVVDLVGTWDADTQTLTLDEDFVYDDGETEKRIWVITKTGPNTYTGTADGVVGTATGVSAGPVLNWHYDFDLGVGGRTVRVHFDDWMILIDDEVLLNRARVSKWGITLGQVELSFKKLPD